MSSPPRRRGRPATITTEHLARTALSLWDRHGYDAVPLSEVAAAADINERTLYRYFTSKSDIVWQTIDTSFTDLHDHLNATPGRSRLMTRVRTGILACFDPEQDQDLTRQRLRIISRTPELYSTCTPPFLTWRTVIQNFVADVLDDKPTALAPQIAAASIQAATMAALTWWAEHSNDDPRATVERALKELDNGFIQMPPHR